VKGGNEAVETLPLKSTSVKAAIAGVIADVKVTQVYRNTGASPLEAVYVFPGSTRSAVYGMKMTIGERTIEAQIQERGQARATYEHAKAEGRTASLLEQHRPNVFQMNVANILPGDEIKVELSYTELLVPEDGTYSFVYPTVVGPRYAGVSGTASSTGEAWVGNPYTHAGEAPLSTLDLQVKLDAGMPIQRMACETHKTSIAYDGADDAVVKLDPSEANGGNRDFVLDYQLSGKRVQSGLLLYKGKDENFFLLMAQPPKRVAPADMPPREFVFIMDISGSQMGFPIEVSKALMKEMIQGLRPQDLFNVMVFEGSAALWSPASRHATPEHLQAALDFVRQQNAGGGTELGSALRKALALPRVPGISRSFVVSTDGYISADASVFDTIRQNLGDANLFAFGIGSSVNRHLIEGMAHAGQGEPFMVMKPEQAAQEAERFRAYVSTPVLSDVKLSSDGFQTYDLQPAHLPDVLAERPVLCFGKWKGEAKGTLTVSGMTGQGRWQQTFQVGETRASASNAALRQLWARERIHLLADYDQFGETDERRKELTSLGLAYHLLTATTSFVAVDTQARNAGGGSTRVVQPLPMPEGVSDAAVGGSIGAVSNMAYAPSPLAYRSEERAQVNAGVRLDMQAAAPELKAQAIPIRLRGLTSDPSGLKLDAIRSQLEARLMDPALLNLLAGLPEGAVLTLRVEASGRVTGVTFDRAFKGSAQATALIRTWRFQAWPASGLTRLHATLASR
jgi:Ca-activated chloride channel family protein